MRPAKRADLETGRERERELRWLKGLRGGAGGGREGESERERARERRRARERERARACGSLVCASV